MRVIPAIDIKDGRCVRLFKGKFDQVTEYAVDPAELAGRYQELGARRVGLGDTTGMATPTTVTSSPRPRTLTLAIVKPFSSLLNVMRSI